MDERTAVLLDEQVVDEVIASCPGRTGDVLSVMEELQKRHPNRYLPRQTLSQVAQKMGVARSQIFSVATFYSFFNLKPQGQHTIMVCRGTACHTRGARNLLETIKSELRLGKGDQDESFSTEDGSLTVRTVACVGQCALAPIVAVDDRIYGRVTNMELKKIIKPFVK